MAKKTINNRSLLVFSSPVVAALAAAALFGASTPFAKQYVSSVPAILLAGILYLGSGVGLLVLRLLRDHGWRNSGLTMNEWPWLLAAITFGGIAGPVLLMLGLAYMPAASASLLLNFEIVFTAILAWFIFKENTDPKIILGMLFIVAGGVLLSYAEQDSKLGTGSIYGFIYILAACFCWGIDNNLMRKVSISDTLFTAGFRGIISAVVNIGWAMSLGYTLPNWLVAGKVMLVGFFGYGVSLVLFLLALRGLGASRTGAYFGVAPFFGAVIAVLFFQESVSPWFWSAGLIMGIGLYFHLTEKHVHVHTHAPLVHAHPHVHDEHHQHKHKLWEDKLPHCHIHTHAFLEHSHRHVPDIHHRHTHIKESDSEKKENEKRHFNNKDQG